MIGGWLGGWLVMALAPGEAAAPVPREAPGPRRTTVFLDFGGGVLGPGDDSSLGQSACVTNEFSFPIFLGSERASEIAVAEARRLVAAYGVRVVAERPPEHLPYTHVRVGGHPTTLGLDSKLNGLACDVDCDDRSPRDTVFMFADKWVPTVVLDELEEEARAVQVGRIAIHEAGHAWGLEHSGASESVMARFPSTGAPSFVEGCLPLDIDSQSECPEPRLRYCDEGQQDAHAELRALFGDGAPDVVAPQAMIVWPPDGLMLEPGETLEVEVAVGDDHGGFGWRLEVPELGWEHVARDSQDTTLSLVIPQGRFTLRLEVLDHDRNASEAQVTIEARDRVVGEAEPMGPQAQCACQGSGQGWPGAWWAVLVLVLGATKPRRREREAGLGELRS